MAGAKKLATSKTIFFVVMGIVIAVMVIIPLATPKNSVSGGVTYSGSVVSCTVNERTYDKCMWVYLSHGETEITNVPWASKTTAGVAEYIRDYLPEAKVNEQVSAWIDLTDWLNNKIYDNTPEAFRDLNKYAKKDGNIAILIAWDHEISNSYWPGWKWIDVNYDYYYDTEGRQMKKYASSNAGFYYNPRTNEVDY